MYFTFETIKDNPKTVCQNRLESKYFILIDKMEYSLDKHL